MVTTNRFRLTFRDVRQSDIGTGKSRKMQLDESVYTSVAGEYRRAIWEFYFERRNAAIGERNVVIKIVIREGANVWNNLLDELEQKKSYIIE